MVKDRLVNAEKGELELTFNNIANNLMARSHTRMRFLHHSDYVINSLVPSHKVTSIISQHSKSLWDSHVQQDCDSYLSLFNMFPMLEVCHYCFAMTNSMD